MMRLIPYVCLFLLAGPAVAQEGPPPGSPDLRAFLELDEAQIAELGRLREELGQRIAPVAAHVREAEQQLHMELSSALPDPLTVGDLVLSIHEGRRQVVEIKLDERQRTTAVLTPEQQDKLNPLRMAAVLRQASAQAVEVNLIGEGDGLDPAE